jgi:hypothetical protein
MLYREKPIKEDAILPFPNSGVYICIDRTLDR